MKKLLGFFLLFGLMTSGIYAQESIVHDLKIQGNKKLKASFIKSITSIKSGSVLDSLTIEADMLRLKRLASVSHVYYQVFASEENQSVFFFFKICMDFFAGDLIKRGVPSAFGAAFCIAIKK